jgi:hypothetical protein
MHFPKLCGPLTIILGACLTGAQSDIASAQQKVWNAKVVVVNNTPYDFDAAAVVHKPSRSVRFQWVDPVVDPKDPDKGVWKAIKKGGQSAPKPIKFVTENAVKERNWWFLALAYKDSAGNDRVFAIKPQNGQAKLDILAKASVAAVQTVGAKEVTALFAATGPGALAAAAVAGVLKIVIDPSKLQSRAGYKEKSLHRGDAGGTIKLVITEEKDEMFLRIVAPTGSTSGRTRFDEEVADLTEIYKRMAAVAKSELKDKGESK